MQVGGRMWFHISELMSERTIPEGHQIKMAPIPPWNWSHFCQLLRYCFLQWLRVRSRVVTESTFISTTAPPKHASNLLNLKLSTFEVCFPQTECAPEASCQASDCGEDHRPRCPRLLKSGITTHENPPSPLGPLCRLLPPP